MTRILFGDILFFFKQMSYLVIIAYYIWCWKSIIRVKNKNERLKEKGKRKKSKKQKTKKTNPFSHTI